MPPFARNRLRIHGSNLATATIGVCLLLGVFFRIRAIGDLVIGGDEIHPIRTALLGDMQRIYGFGDADHSIPITLCCRVLLDTVGLDEVGLRALPLLAGVGILVLVGMSSHRLKDGAVATAAAFAVATSPILVYYSREGRPYGIVATLGAAGLLALVRYSQSRRCTDAGLFVATQALMHFSSPTSLPFTAGLCGAGLVWELLGERGSRVRRAAAPILLGAASLLVTTLLLLPALPSLLAVLRSKSADAAASIGVGSLLDSLRIVFGLDARVPEDPLAFLVLIPILFTVIGIVSVAKESVRFAAGTLTLLLLPPIMLALLRVEGYAEPKAFVRYNAALIPIALLLACRGLVVCTRGILRARRSLASPVALGVLILTVASGPLWRSAPPGRPFGLRASTLFSPLRLELRGDFALAPPFYRELRGHPTLLEYPAVPRAGYLFAIYQTRHGCRVVRCFQQLPADPRLRFRTIRAGEEGIIKGVAQGGLLIMHHDPVKERWMINLEPGVETRTEVGRVPAGYQRLRNHAEMAFGAPIYEDEWIAVFRAETMPQ